MLEGSIDENSAASSGLNCYLCILKSYYNSLTRMMRTEEENILLAEISSDIVKTICWGKVLIENENYLNFLLKLIANNEAKIFSNNYLVLFQQNNKIIYSLLQNIFQNTKKGHLSYDLFISIIQLSENENSFIEWVLPDFFTILDKKFHMYQHRSSQEFCKPLLDGIEALCKIVDTIFNRDPTPTQLQLICCLQHYQALFHLLQIDH